MPNGVWMSKIIIPLSVADALFSALAVSLFGVQIIFSTEVGSYLQQIYFFSSKEWISSITACKVQWNWSFYCFKPTRKSDVKQTEMHTRPRKY